MLLNVSNVKKKYGQVDVLKGVQLNCQLGEHLAIKGASGSGKSTLLHLLAGLERPSEGVIKLGGLDISNLSDEKLAHYRNQYIGLVFQFHYLLPNLTNLENMLLPSKIGRPKVDGVKKRVLHLSEKLRIGHCLNKSPYEISGGEQQRINIIRALSLNPKLLLCDEPTGNLDSENSKLVMGIILQMASELNSTLIVVTHDDEIAKQLTSIKIMQDGILI